jgi:hypothetical protein
MVSWIALVLALLSGFIASIALGVALWIYFRGPKVRALDPDELFDLLLEQNDTNLLFREKPFDD